MHTGAKIQIGERGIIHRSLSSILQVVIYFTVTGMELGGHPALCHTRAVYCQFPPSGSGGKLGRLKIQKKTWDLRLGVLWECYYYNML